MRPRRCRAAGLGIALLCGLFLACGGQESTSAEKHKIAVGIQRTALYRHVLFADKRGIFEKYGLQVELVDFESANALMTSLLAGGIDVAGLTNLQVAATAHFETSAELYFLNFHVWTKDAFPDYLLVRSESAAKSIAYLRGRRIGVHPGTATTSFARALFRKEGIDIGELTEVEPQFALSALRAGTVDALYCLDPVCTVAMHEGIGRILLENPLGSIFPPPIPISGAAVTGRFLRRHREVVARLTAALDESIRALRVPSNAEGALEAIASSTGVEVGLLRTMRPSEYWTSREIDEARLGDFLETLFKIGAIRGRVAPTELLPKRESALQREEP